MSRRDLQRCAAGLRDRNSVSLWLAAAAFFVLFWSASSLTPAQAARLQGADLATALSTAVHEHGLAPDSPVALEADLPQFVDNASHTDFDDNAALQRQSVVTAFGASTPRSILQRHAAPPQRARVFNPRAPPSLH